MTLAIIASWLIGGAVCLALLVLGWRYASRYTWSAPADEVSRGADVPASLSDLQRRRDAQRGTR